METVIKTMMKPTAKVVFKTAKIHLL